MPILNGYLITIFFAIIFGSFTASSYAKSHVFFGTTAIIALFFWVKYLTRKKNRSITKMLLFILISCLTSRFLFYHDASYLISSLLNLNFLKANLILVMGVLVVSLKSLLISLITFYIVSYFSRIIKATNFKKFIFIMANFLAIEVAMSYPLFISPTILLFTRMPKGYDLSWKLSFVVLPLLLFSFFSLLIILIDKKKYLYSTFAFFTMLSFALLPFLRKPTYEIKELKNLFFINQKMSVEQTHGPPDLRFVLNTILRDDSSYKTNKENVFIWPEVYFYVNKKRDTVANIELALKSTLPGTHYFGVNEDNDSYMLNKYIQLNHEDRTEQSFYLKRRLVSVIEDGHVLPKLFEKIGYTRVNFLPGSSDTVLKHKDLKIKIRLCSEIGDIGMNLLLDNFEKIDLILSPSNISTSIDTDLDEKYSTYSHILSRFSGISVLRSSSSNDVRLFHPNGDILYLSHKNSIIHKVDLEIKNVIK